MFLNGGFMTPSFNGALLEAFPEAVENERIEGVLTEMLDALDSYSHCVNSGNKNIISLCSHRLFTKVKFIVNTLIDDKDTKDNLYLTYNALDVHVRYKIILKEENADMIELAHQYASKITNEKFKNLAKEMIKLIKH